MFGAFADESGTHRGAPVVVVAAYAAPLLPVDYWARFRVEWTSRVMKGNNSAILHMKEAVRKLGRVPEWEERLASAVEIINTHTLIRFACAIDVAAHAQFVRDWRRRMPRGFEPETAYCHGALTCISEIAETLRRRHLDDDVTYSFEDGHRNFGQLRVILDALIAQPEIRRHVRLSAFRTQRKHERIELQAADLMAFWLREYVQAVEIRKEHAATMHPLAQRLREHEYVFWDAARFATYLEDQQTAVRDASREWWRSRIRDQRKASDDQKGSEKESS